MLIRNCLCVKEAGRMSLTEGNQPTQESLWNIICQGQFAFTLRWWCIAFHSYLRWWVRRELNPNQKSNKVFSRLCTNSRTTAMTHLHLGYFYGTGTMTSLQPSPMHRFRILYNPRFGRNRIHSSIFWKCFCEGSDIRLISCCGLLWSCYLPSSWWGLLWTTGAWTIHCWMFN